MRKWQNYAAPDDPDSWFDVDGMWPTNRGSYETVDFTTATNLTATGSGSVVYAWCGKATSSATDPEYVVDAAHIWQYNGGALTDRTGGVAISSPNMTQYGDVTICAMGVTTPTVKSTSPGTNFSALAGAPQAAIVLVQSNAVLAFNTNASPDGWAATDVGDYTNWATGEAASGRIIAAPGAIIAAVAFGNDVIVFKANSIYRMRYVGGLVKWTVELVWSGSACSVTSGASAGSTGILFCGTPRADTGNPSMPWYWYDGANAPVQVNPLTEIPAGVPAYDPIRDRFMVWGPSAGGAAFYFNPATRAWGKWSGYGTGNKALAGDGSGRRELSSTITSYVFGGANLITRNAVSGGGDTGTPGTCYLHSSKYGRPDRKTTFSRVTPILRRRTDLGSLTATLIATFFREREDTTAQTTLSGLTETTLPVPRHRFDISGVGSSDNFGRFKVTWVNADIEADDFLVAQDDTSED